MEDDCLDRRLFPSSLLSVGQWHRCAKDNIRARTVAIIIRRGFYKSDPHFRLFSSRASSSKHTKEEIVGLRQCSRTNCWLVNKGRCPSWRMGWEKMHQIPAAGIPTRPSLFRLAGTRAPSGVRLLDTVVGSAFGGKALGKHCISFLLQLRLPLPFPLLLPPLRFQLLRWT